MLDFTALQARAEYKQDQFLREAAHERLLREVRRAPASRRGRLLAAAVAAALLIPLVPRPATAPVEAMPSASVLASTAAPTLGPTAGSHCWITGDLVGEGNPATVALPFCGQ